MKRLYDQLIHEHFKQLRQMIFLAGPRQVGKTTASLKAKREAKKLYYFNWDDDETQRKIVAGSGAVAKEANLQKASKDKPVIVFDEIHKYGRWKRFLKGFFDVYGHLCHILVIGSSKLNIYKKTGDSLMGRYFLYRVHPLTVAETLRPNYGKKEISPPKKIPDAKLLQLLEFGGFPEPFLKANKRFTTNWRRIRQEQLIKEDIRDLSQIQELAQLDLLTTVLADYAGKQISYTNLANLVNTSSPTIQRWLKTLEAFYYCFPLRPWTKNVKNSLKKEPKYYLWDWSLATERGRLIENFIASHLLKAVHFWTDSGLGEFGLHYVRDKQKREVDFLVTKNKKPWFLVEAKSGNNSGISKSLHYFHEQIGTSHAFQVSFEMEYIDKDCFSYKSPIIVPVSTFLSQLV